MNTVSAIIAQTIPNELYLDCSNALRALQANTRLILGGSRAICATKANSKTPQEQLSAVNVVTGSFHFQSASTAVGQLRARLANLGATHHHPVSTSAHCVRADERRKMQASKCATFAEKAGLLRGPEPIAR